MHASIFLDFLKLKFHAPCINSSISLNISPLVYGIHCASIETAVESYYTLKSEVSSEMKNESFDIYIYFIILSIHLLLCQPVILPPSVSIVSIACTVVIDWKYRFRFPQSQSLVRPSKEHSTTAAPLRTTSS